MAQNREILFKTTGYLEYADEACQKFFMSTKNYKRIKNIIHFCMPCNKNKACIKQKKQIITLINKTTS